MSPWNMASRTYISGHPKMAQKAVYFEIILTRQPISTK